MDFFLYIILKGEEIKIWDAGCSFGAEPYTFAIMLAERMGHFGFKKIKIEASDIDSKFGKVILDRIYEYKDLGKLLKSYPP